MFGGEDEDSLSRISMMASPLQYTPVLPQHQLPQTATQPQWSQEETRELIRIRAELERDFTVAKRNKTLWEVVSSRMTERGYRRTPDQCKCKWKNLLNRYKGSETSDPENSSRQCPFFEELQALFSERAKNMQRLHLESEKASACAKRKSKNKTSGDRLSEETSDDEDDDGEETDEERPVGVGSRKRKAGKPANEKHEKLPSAVQGSGGGADVCRLLKEFFEQQRRMDVQWREMMERRANERLLFEQEWRRTMEKLEKERLMVEQAWREREEQRRLREESRAERRDALLTTLLNKLIHEHNL